MATLQGEPAATTAPADQGADDMAAIAELLGRANEALREGRPEEARSALRAAHPLLMQRVAAAKAISAIITVQAALMAARAGDVDLAAAYAALVVDEVGGCLEELGQRFQRQAESGDRDGARQTQVEAYVRAVAFIPFVQGVRAANLPPQDPSTAEAETAAAIGYVLKHVRPPLDAIGWAEWPYPQGVARRARYWSAHALVHWGHLLMENFDSGEDASLAQGVALCAGAMLEGLPEDELTADLWNLRGRIYFAFGHAHDAQSFHAMQEAARICLALGNERGARTDYANLGAMMLTRAAFVEAQSQTVLAQELRASAEKYLEDACPALHQLGDAEAFVKAAVNLLALHAEQKQWSRMRPLFFKAWRALPRLGDQAVYLAPLLAGNWGAALFDQGRLRRAEQWLRTALRDLDAVTIDNPQLVLIVKGKLGRLLHVTGRHQEASEQLGQALDRLQRWCTSYLAERSSNELLKRFRWIFEAMIDCCVTLGEVDPARHSQAFELAEHLKWRSSTVLLRYLPLGLLDERREPRLRQEADLLQQARAALGLPADAAAASAEAFAQLESLWNEMEADHPQYVAFRRQQTVRTADAAALLDYDVPCLVEYYLGDQYDLALAFIVDREHRDARAVRLPLGPAAIGRLVSEMRQGQDRQPIAAFQAVARQLHDALIAPVSRWLPAAGRGLCIVPYGPLHNLPFAALFDGTQYLVERQPIVIAPSASALRWWVEKDPKRSSRCLVFTATSDVYSAQERQIDLVLFEDLARRRLAPLFEASKLVTGAQATRGALLEEFEREPGWDVVHIACHGEFGDEGEGNRGLGSRLVMAGPASEGKDLPAIDIFSRIRTGASLVVLSACESAMAETSTNDELAGLAQAFLLAGASSVLATTSYVRQEPGVAVSERFYRLWKRGDGGLPLRKSAALQRAQCELLKRRRWIFFGRPRWHPHQWSAFSLYGNWK